MLPQESQIRQFDVSRLAGSELSRLAGSELSRLAGSELSESELTKSADLMHIHQVCLFSWYCLL